MFKTKLFVSGVGWKAEYKKTTLQQQKGTFLQNEGLQEGKFKDTDYQNLNFEHREISKINFYLYILKKIYFIYKNIYLYTR